MRIVVGVMLAFLGVNAFGGGIYGISTHQHVIPSLILCVIVGGTCVLAATAAFAENVFWRPLAYAASVIALGFVGVELAVLGYVSWLQPAVLAYVVVVSALTWAAPIRPRRSQQDHLASSSARTA